MQRQASRGAKARATVWTKMGRGFAWPAEACGIDVEWRVGGVMGGRGWHLRHLLHKFPRHLAQHAVRQGVARICRFLNLSQFCALRSLREAGAWMAQGRRMVGRNWSSLLARGFLRGRVSGQRETPTPQGMVSGATATPLRRHYSRVRAGCTRLSIKINSLYSQRESQLIIHA